MALGCPILQLSQTKHSPLGINASLLMTSQTPHFKTPNYCKIQEDLPGGHRLNQCCVNTFGKVFNVTDIHLYIINSILFMNSNKVALEEGY